MLDLQYGVVIWTTISFLLVIIILGKFGWRPIMKALNDREATIRDALESAEKARKEMEQLNASNEELIREARIERDKLLKEARTTKEKIIGEAKDAANIEAARLMENARIGIENEKKNAIADIKNQVAVLSVEIAEKILKDQLKTDGKQEKIIQEAIGEISLN